MSNIPTIGGVPTKDEAYRKLMDHLIQCEEMAAVISHLHNTEDNDMDKLLARGWLGVSEMFQRTRSQIIQLATGRMMLQ